MNTTTVCHLNNMMEFIARPHPTCHTLSC